MKLQSNIDSDTYYTVTTKYVRMCRNGDKLTMQWSQLPEQAKRFRPDVQEELMAIYSEKHPLIACPCCGKKFHKANGKKYCSQECYDRFSYEKAKSRHTLKTQTCLRCGNEFFSNCRRKYCGSVCEKEARRSKPKKTKEDSRKTWESSLNEKLKQAKGQGLTYAELQMQETLKQVGKVVI